MATITITLPDEQLALLQKVAAQQGVSVESLIETKIVSTINQSQTSFQDAADYVLRKKF